jgi:ribokinase
MKKGKIVVFGSFVVDLTSRASHLPVPGETVIGSKFKLGPGGKGSNQGVAAHRAGADVIMATKVGNDVFGKVATDFYTAEGMDTRYIFIDDAVETGTALIMVDENSGQNQILVVSGACGHIADEDIEAAMPAILEADILLLQLEINLDALEKLVQIAHNNGKMVVLNTAPAQKIPAGILEKTDIVTPNEIEAGILTGVEIKSPGDAIKAGEAFMQMGVLNVVITLGKDGVFVMTKDRHELIPSIKVNAIDTTGAGDAFNGGFVTALAEGMDIFEAARFGNITGALSVTRLGTAPAMPFRKEIDDLF